MTTKRQPIDNQLTTCCGEHGNHKEKLVIHDWDKWQSFRKDRGTPPWIKIHRCLLTCGKWATLSDQEKGQLVSMWIVAADKEGELPANAKVLQKVCQLDTEPDIQKFVSLQLLDHVGCQVVVKLTPSGCQVDAPEERREEKRREEESAQKSARFAPPSQEDVKKYCEERQRGVDPEKWFNFYSAKGWMVGRNKMKDWKAAVRTWEEVKQDAPKKEEDKKCAGCGILVEFGCNGKTAESRACARYEQQS